MTEHATTPVEVFRVVPRYHDSFKGILLEDDQILRWELDEQTVPLPAEIPGSLHGELGGTPADYPTSDPASPVLSAALLEAVRDRFSGTGHFIPVNVPGLAAGTYTAYVPATVADCLDQLNSSTPEATGRIRKAAFHQDRVPVQFPAFRLPQNRTYVYWNAWAARLIESSAAPGSVELRLVWSSNPTATPHRDPMGF
ncbi:hypothetical protein FB563_0102 [Streptomyces puniciscabiei]|uniref:Uncharacterized protein n=1 Tax=Streptomyces puniciscabiei TaxID=164348 RepID=A0A542U812_9ACTN|nr:hypothetical protein [Streptomyces puniciscabiei]TQK95230.1 hypothetical protein FB563_0102 [Streptomyces puniciscabiei]